VTRWLDEEAVQPGAGIARFEAEFAQVRFAVFRALSAGDRLRHGSVIFRMPVWRQRLALPWVRWWRARRSPDAVGPDQDQSAPLGNTCPRRRGR
jgi:hypothetical protein